MQDETVGLSLVDFVLGSIRPFGDKIAQINSESTRRITFDEIAKKVDLFGGYLRRIGVKKDDVVCLCSKNNVDYSWLLLGTLQSQATCLLISSASKQRELEHALCISETLWIIDVGLSEEQLEAVKSLQVKRIKLSEYSEDTWRDSHLTERRGSWDELYVDQPALLLMSSGSTGLPKCVTITHKNLVTSLRVNKDWMDEDAVALGLMPFNHAYGLVIMLLGLCAGATLVTMSSFEVGHFINVIQDYKITHLHLVPSLLSTLGKNELFTKDVLRTVRFIWTGAGMIKPKHQECVLEKLSPESRLFHSYGMTETTFVVFSGEYRSDKPGSCGKCLPCFSVKVISKDGQSLRHHKVGELCFKGPTIMKGYLNNVKATKDVIDNDGWLHSGDLGYFDTDGYFFIVDRIKEIIKYQGFQVSPSEIESVLLLHPGVEDAAVVGTPHPEYGELPRAFIVPSESWKPTEEELLQLVKNELSLYKQLRGGVRFVSYIPKTPSGKIMRNEVKKLYLN